MSQRIDGCRKCELRLNPQGGRMSEGHLAIRFDPSLVWAKVFLAGEQIFDCFEVLAGEGGWALRVHTPGVLCPCGSGEIFSFLDMSDEYSVRYEPGRV